MGASGGFPIELIVFGMFAAFLVLRLRSILGRRQGFERPAERVAERPGEARPAPRATDGPVIEAVAERPAGSRPLPDPAGPVGTILSRMQGVDRNFQAARFLDGAEAAFRIIVTAFAGGDRDALRGLLNEETYRAFEAAIAAREAAGETQRSDIRAIQAATIEAAELRGTWASISVRFVSDQVSLTTGKDGAVVSGTDAVTEITDLWTFERDLATSDPTWRLTGARSA